MPGPTMLDLPQVQVPTLLHADVSDKDDSIVTPLFRELIQGGGSQGTRKQSQLMRWNVYGI
jgi:hypothetical protein